MIRFSAIFVSLILVSGCASIQRPSESDPNSVCVLPAGLHGGTNASKVRRAQKECQATVATGNMARQAAYEEASETQAVAAWALGAALVVITGGAVALAADSADREDQPAIRQIVPVPQ